MPYASSANRFAFMLFCGFSLLVPGTAETGWFFKPSTFYECLKEIGNVESNKAVKNARDYCFDEFCRNKGRVIEIDNKKVRFRCQQRDALYGEAKSKWEQKRLSYVWCG